MRDPKAIRKAIMTAKSIASLVDPKFARVPLPDLGVPAPQEYVPEHSSAMHEAFGVPMPKGYAAGGEIEALHFASGGEVLKAWRNPSPKALRNLTERSTHKAMRGLHHGNDQFWWDADHAIHHDAAQMLGIPYDYKNRMDARVDSVSGNYGIGADEGVPDHIVSHYERAAGDDDHRYASGGGVDDENPYTEPNDLGFYSHAAVTAAGLPQERGTPEQFRGVLLNKGVKPSEFEWSGYDDAFADQPMVTRQQIAEHFHAKRPPVEEKRLQNGPTEAEWNALLKKHQNTLSEYQKNSREDPDFDSDHAIWKSMGERHTAERREIRDRYGKPHHEEYTIPGGKHYREILLKHGGDESFPGVPIHFKGEPDVLASMMVKDRKDTEGDKVFHIDELQSDWAQRGRQQGFSERDSERLTKAKAALESVYDKLTDEEIDQFVQWEKNNLPEDQRNNWDSDELRSRIAHSIRMYPEHYAKRHNLADEWDVADREYGYAMDEKRSKSNIDRAPYVTKTEDWVDLALKRALRDAAEHGYDKIAWSPGHKIADRYDLTKHVGEIRHEKNDDGTYNLDIADPKGIRVFEQDDMSPEEVADYLGKGMADKIFAGHGDPDENPGYRDWRTLSGLDLKIGAQWPFEMYDRMIHKRALRLAKMHDPEAAITKSTIKHPDQHYDDDEWSEDGYMPNPEHTDLHAIRITPKMRESILKKGFPAYAQGGEVEGHEVANPMSIFPKPQRMWDEDMPGGAYLSMPDKQDVTGHRASSASIGIGEGGKPYFNASRDPAEVTGSPGRGSATVKTNLFKQKAGWKWLDTPEGHDNTNTLVSVEHRGKHHYVLHAHFPKGVDLARYPDAPSEPRLRPTTKGNVELGPQVGSISVRGKEHPVHSHAIVKAYGGEVEGYADGGEIDPELFKQYMKRIHSPLNDDPESVRRALQIAGSYRSPIGMETGVGSLYNIKQSLPAKDVRATIGDIPGIKMKKPVKKSWEDFYEKGKGGVFINMGGDLSNFGRLTHVNDKELAWPVDLHAGTKFMLEPNPKYVWGNAAGHSTAFENKIRAAEEAGKDAYGIFSPMGPSAVNSSHNMFDALMAQIPNAGIDKKHLREFDAALKRGDHLDANIKSNPKKLQAHLDALKAWPGLENAKEASEYARPEAGNLTGTHRTMIVKFMDKADWLKKGFPEVGVTRAAITDPELKGVGGNKIGHRIVKLSSQELPGAKRAFEHSTYPTYTGGEYVMDVPLVQRHYAAPDVVEQMIRKPTKAGQVVHPYSEDTLGRATARKLFEEQKQMQPINQRMLDSVMMGMENQEKYGFKKGGTVRKAMMIAKGNKKK